MFYKYIFICFHFLSTFVSNNLLYDVMRAIFIGFSAIMVSIIVFVFGIVFNRKHQLEKTFILNKLKIKNVMSLCIIIYFLLFLFSKEVSGSFFIIFKIIVACLIVRLMWLTYKILNNIIRINVDINYFNSELENYVYNHIVELDKKIDDINLKDEKTNQKELDNLIKKKKELSNDIIPAIFNNQYKPIYANKKAIVINIDCPKISNDIDKNNKRTRKIGKLNENPKLIIMVNIGDKVVEKSIIGFYLKDSGSYSKNFSQYITYNDKYRYIDEDIKLINGYLIDNFYMKKLNMMTTMNCLIT